jgi:uncharacterized membrane protein
MPRGGEPAELAWWLNKGDGEDARNLLSTLLTALITMASMTFSITVVALTLAANPYGSRLIRIFRADLRTQATLGLFAATIVYTLLVLRTVEGKAPIDAVPHLAVALGTGLALLCVLALLVFIQGIARTIVADNVVERVGRDLEEAVDALPPLHDSNPPQPPPSEVIASLDAGAAQVALALEGYVQAVDYDGLVAWATERDAVVSLGFRAGHFLVTGDRQVRVQPPQARWWGRKRPARSPPSLRSAGSARRPRIWNSRPVTWLRSRCAGSRPALTIRHRSRRHRPAARGPCRS